MANNELNVERKSFEEWATGPDGPWTPRAVAQRVGDSYGPPELAIQWDCWLARAAAFATPAQAEPSDALPELPAPRIADISGEYGYSEEQVHEIILADRDSREQPAKQAIEARILGQQGGGDAARVSELELLLQKAARGLRFRSSYTNGDPVLEELWAYMMKHYPRHEGRMSGWASMRDDWQTTSGPHCFGCPCQACKAAAVQAQAGDAKEGGSRG